MATVTSPSTLSTPPVIQRAKRKYGRPKPTARPDISSELTGHARAPTMESSSVVEDSEPERVRYRECFASTDLSDPPTSANKNHKFGNWRHELERIDADFDDREDVAASPVKLKTTPRVSASQTDTDRTPFGMRNESKDGSQTSASKDRSGILSSAKSGSSRHPSSSPERGEKGSPTITPAAPCLRDEEEEKNAFPRARVQTTKGIARIFEDSCEEEQSSPLRRPRTQRHGTRPLHETESSPDASSAQGTKRGSKRLLRRQPDGSITSKKPKPKAREAPRFLGDGEDGDDELLFKDAKKGKLKETVPDDKDIEAFLADGNSEEESSKRGKKRKSKSAVGKPLEGHTEKAKEPKEKPLTRKQLIEMEKETAKMKAERTVDAQACAIWHPRTILGFLQRTLSKGQKDLTTIPPPPPRHVTPPPTKQPSSDPIVDTTGSSSPDVAPIKRNDAPIAQTPEFVPAPPTTEARTPPAQKNKAFVSHPSDYEDDEPADLDEIRRHARQQKEAEAKAKAMQQAAREKKMAALHAKSNIPVVDDDDELEVEESPKKASLKRKRGDASDQEGAVKPKPTATSKGRAIQAQFGAVKSKPNVAGGRKDVAHAGPSHKELNQMLLKRTNEQKLAVIKAKEEDYEARGGRLKRRRRIVPNDPGFAELIEALERAPLPGENYAKQDSDRDDGDYSPELESPCKSKVFVAGPNFVDDEIKIKVEEEEESLPLATFEGGFDSPLPVKAPLLEDENPFPLHLRPTQPRRLHGTDSEDDNPFPLHLRPKQPRRLHGTDSENEDANPFPPHLRPKHARRVMSSDEEGDQETTRSKRSSHSGKARGSIKPLGESQSHHNLGTCSAATSSTESLNSVQLPQADPRERLFSSTSAVPPPPLARSVSGRLEMYSDSGGDMVRHHSANASFNLPTFEPLACLPTLPSPGLPSPTIHMTPVALLSTPTEASTSKVSPGGSLLPAKDNYQLTARGVHYFNLESGHEEFLDRPLTPPPKGDAIRFGGINSQLFFSQAGLSEAGSPTNALRHGKSPVKPVDPKTQMQPPSQPPTQVEDADEEPVIRPIKKIASFAFSKSESPEPAPKPFDPLAHLRVPIATEGFGFTQEVEGAGPLPELKLNTQEAAKFERVEAEYLDDLLRERYEMRKVDIIEARAAGQPLEPSWLNDDGMFTQNQPPMSSPRTIMAWPFTPSPHESPIKLNPSSSDAEASPCKPGRGLKRKADLEANKEADESSSPRKIARTESTETIAGPSDAFVVMMGNRQFVDAKKEKRRQRKTAEKEELESIEKEFVAGEADESDDELDFGFGKLQKNDEEDVQGDEPTAEDKAMVDDRVLGAQELKEDAVLEKHKEHLEEDDAALQKIHEAAVAGKLRGGKKRGRDVAMSDSESEDEEYHRRPKCKKRKVAGDKLEDLAHDDETKAFYVAYQNDLEDQDDDLKHLNIVHSHIPGIEDAADPVGDEDMDIEGEIQEATWKRDAGVSDSPNVEEDEECLPSPETGAGNDFDLDRFVDDAYPSSPGAFLPQKFTETDLRRRPTTELENADDLQYPVTRHRCSVNAQWAKENSKHHESSARGGAATVVVRSKGARGPKRMASDIKPMPKGLSRRGTLGPTLKKSWDEA